MEDPRGNSRGNNGGTSGTENGGKGGEGGVRRGRRNGVMNGGGGVDGGGGGSNGGGGSGGGGSKGRRKVGVEVEEGKALLPRVCLCWGLVNEVCLKYCEVVLERWGEHLDVNPISRLRLGHVLYLENDEGRFQVWAKGREDVDVEDEKLQLQFKFFLGMIKEEVIFKLIAKNVHCFDEGLVFDERLDMVPLLEEFVDVKSTVVNSDQIAWDESKFTMGFFSMPVLRLSWSSPTDKEDPQPSHSDGSSTEHR